MPLLHLDQKYYLFQFPFTHTQKKRKKENLRLVLRQELPRKDQDLNPRRFKTVLIYDYNSDLEMMDAIIKGEKNVSNI